MSLTVNVLCAPNESHVLTKREALIICGQYFGMCYVKDDFDKIKNEDAEKSINRAMMCIKSGHHSGFEHVKFTFEILDISKTLAMILNNQGNYATSEKSGRYTVLSIENEEEEALRKKWQDTFYNIIHDEHYEMFHKFYAKPDMEPEKVEKAINLAITKKAQENSRLITSPFAKTKMIYSINFRQLNYLRYEIKEFINEMPDTFFYARIKAEMKEFLEATSEWAMEDEGLNPGSKGVKLPFFETAKERKEEFGENYSINYYVSYATFAQIQRHRTTHCTMSIPTEKKYFIPAFIENKEELVKEWVADCEAVTSEESFPQATLMLVNERGRYEDFELKCYERLCGAAQYEVAMVMKEQLTKYLENTTSENAYNALSKINCGARCKFGFKCNSPCMFGAKYAFDRKF